MIASLVSNAGSDFITTAELVSFIFVGLIVGVLGGLLGIGGSIIMIPVLTLIFRHNQHLSQAAAMIVNIFVAIPSMIQHHREKAVRWDVVWRAMPGGVVFIVIGVELSNVFDGEILQRFFGAFLLYVIFMNIKQLFSKGGEPEPHEHVIKWWSCGFVGICTGFSAGLLGIGGGVITVPLLQRVCRLPLRQSIATSAAIMVLTAVVGAIRKNLVLADITTIGDEVLRWQESVIIAACFIPTAMVGGWLGAKLTHSMKIRYVRIAFILLLVWAAWKMLGFMDLFGQSASAYQFGN
ncbi:MAG: sulfite exporter TauE/SafE family protein [Planctomycetota bacterium]|nr:sulfite exporter TauE/SafE family protein [Planctomycetota bacterium]